MAECVETEDRGHHQSMKGGSARERVLRFNRGVIGLCVAALFVLLLLPVGR